MQDFDRSQKRHSQNKHKERHAFPMGGRHVFFWINSAEKIFVWREKTRYRPNDNLEIVAHPYNTKGNSLYNRMAENIKFFLTWQVFFLQAHQTPVKTLSFLFI